MTKRLLVRLAAGVAGGLLALGASAPAYASGPALHVDHQNRTAASFGDQDCEDRFFEARPADHDGWHFVLPEGNADFVSLTLDFQTPAGTESIVIPEQDGLIREDQPKHAYLFTPAGWTLLDGVAEVTTAVGPADQFFNVSHTCPGDAGGPGPTAVPSSAPPAAPTTEPEVPGEVDQLGLPVTGMQVGGMVLLGSGLLAGGIAMLAVRRRRSAASLADED